MPLPETVSLRVPYTDNEQRFLLFAVEAALRTFRSINLDCAEGQVCLTSGSQFDTPPSLPTASI